MLVILKFEEAYCVFFLCHIHVFELIFEYMYRLNWFWENMNLVFDYFQNFKIERDSSKRMDLIKIVPLMLQSTPLTTSLNNILFSDQGTSKWLVPWKCINFLIHHITHSTLYKWLCKMKFFADSDSFFLVIHESLYNF